jgi:hypothetical protein
MSRCRIPSSVLCKKDYICTNPLHIFLSSILFQSESFIYLTLVILQLPNLNRYNAVEISCELFSKVTNSAALTLSLEFLPNSVSNVEE